MKAYSFYQSKSTKRIYGSSNFRETLIKKIKIDCGTNPHSKILIFHDPMLIIMPFTIKKWQTHYINPEVIKIDTSLLAPDEYKVMAIHNFQVEDCNPNLDECLAGIFLSRNQNNRWEEAEDQPHECRTIAFLAMIDTRNKNIQFKYVNEFSNK